VHGVTADECEPMRTDVIFDIQTLTLRAKRQSVQVSKITNDGLTGLARDAL